jgi:hypothetical protein
MAATYAERLQLVRNAIDEILLDGQSNQFDGRMKTRADLDGLRELEKEYESRAGQEAVGGRRRSRVIYVTPQ